jgi:patatin-like phospholipase/acyl hydrolase
MSRPTTILSIDGGGIRGLIPAIVLERMEQITGRPIASLFKIIAGTSTGGILALGLSCCDETGAPRYKASDLVEMYTKDAQTIFPHEFLPKVRSVIQPKYPAKGRAAVLQKKLGDGRLRDTATEVIVTSYDIERRQPFFFRSALAKRNPEHDFAIRDVALATSAAPTYFEPVCLKSAEPERPFVLVDGGVFANNPGMCAFVDESSVKGTVEGTLMVSLGTGSLTRPFRYEEAKKWGVLRWAPHVLDVVFDGVSDAVDFQLAQLLGRDRYQRFQVGLDIAKDEMDDVQPSNIENLIAQAGELLSKESARLEAVCEQLVNALEAEPQPAPSS